METVKKFIDPKDAIIYFGFDCMKDDVNAFYVGVHAISINTYERMIKNFDDTSGGIGTQFKNFPSSNLNVTGFGCNDYIEYNTGPNPNSTIILSKIDILDDESIPLDMDKFAIGKYSIHFFRGLQKYFPIPASTSTQEQIYRFTKAKNDAGVETLVLQVLNDNVAVYHGDLTHMFP